ncbi:MAG: protein-disulfide isomerase [Hyphomicrobiaceae bacterium]|jgi:protein-disulfide isomerase
MKAFFMAATVAFALSFAPNLHADEIVATVGGQPVTMEELVAELKPQLAELDNQRFEILENGLSGLIAARLIETEAKALGVTPEQLEKTEIVEKVTEPDEAEVLEVFEASKGQLGPDANIDELRPRIIEFLQSRGAGERAQVYLTELRDKYAVEVKLEAPKVEVALGSHSPRGGGADAPITIVGFSDYECPFCKRGEEAIEKVLDTYGDKVRYFHRDFPLDFHANAHKAAQAAHCAEDQEKYWEYHAGLFASEGLSDDRFAAIADELELDRTAFDECLSNSQFAAEVDTDMADGAAVGVNGTPAFFVNGRTLTGAQPFESFQKIIEAELAKVGATKPAADAADTDSGPDEG